MPNKLTPFAKSLRKEATDTEQLLWCHLKAKRFGGIKFRRQQPIGKYIVDFVSFEKKMIIELDGGQHTSKDERQKDCRRDECLQAQGYRILRFWDHEVLTSIEAVMEVIRTNCSDHPPLDPLPSREGKNKSNVVKRVGRG